MVSGPKALVALALFFFLLILTTGCGGNAQADAPKSPKPTITFTAAPPTINAGQASTLAWNISGASSASIDQGVGNVSLSGSAQVKPSATTTYTISASGSGGQATATATVTVATPVTPPQISSFTANPNSVQRGQLSTLTWQTSNATAVTITPGIKAEDNQKLPVSGSATVLPSAATTYTLTATGPGGSTTATVTVSVTEPPPTLTLSVAPTSIIAGQSATLTWTGQNATAVTIDNGVGSVSAPSGTKSVSPATTTTYTATATGPGGSVSASATLTVQQQLAVTLATDKTQIASGQSVTLTWTSQSATALDIQPGVGTVNANGSVAVTPQQTTTYTITAHDAAGNTKTAQVAITVVAAGGLTSIKHILFFLQENRSFDNYFGMLGQYRVTKGLPKEIDGLDSPNVKPQADEHGALVHPFHQQTVCAENTSPSWNPSWHAFNGGLLDGFVSAHDIPSTIDEQYHRTMAYYDQTELPYYYELATQFATSDRFYSPVMAGTIPNRMYMFAATSAGHIFPDPPPQGGFALKTIFELLRDAHVSWRYYYMDNSVFLSQFKGWSDPAISDNVVNISEYYKILADPNADTLLPQVVFIERAGETGLDEHPDNNTQLGAAVGANVINALLASKAWASSAFILTYDEAGGLYDHVAPFAVPAPDNIQPIASSGFETPLPGDFQHSGFRIPMIVISPWVKPNFVSHTPRDLTSILKLIEKRFALPALTARDAAADDMLEFFDFSTPHLLTPPALPAQPTAGTCDFNLETAGQN